ncbi:MAG: hypothetical protein ACXVX3_20365 [Blastococcus sp.]
MPDERSTRRDRLLWAGVAGLAVLGLVCVALGVWATRHDGLAPPDTRSRPEAGIAAGVLFLVVAGAEALRRVRHGRQPPGRHARD